MKVYAYMWWYVYGSGLRECEVRMLMATFVVVITKVMTKRILSKDAVAVTINIVIVCVGICLWMREIDLGRKWPQYGRS